MAGGRTLEGANVPWTVGPQDGVQAAPVQEKACLHKGGDLGLVLTSFNLWELL